MLAGTLAAFILLDSSIYRALLVIPHLFLLRLRELVLLNAIE